MPKQLRTQIDINADADRVWHVLTDFYSYFEWNPFIIHAKGRAAVDERLTLRMQPRGGRAMTFRPTVLEAEPGKQLRWLGRLGIPGLFDGEHIFHLEPVGDKGTRVVQEEHFRGLLVPLMSRSLDNGSLPAFEDMNAALKVRAERNG